MKTIENTQTPGYDPKMLGNAAGLKGVQAPEAGIALDGSRAATALPMVGLGVIATACSPAASVPGEAAQPAQNPNAAPTLVVNGSGETRVVSPTVVSGGGQAEATPLAQNTVVVASEPTKAATVAPTVAPTETSVPKVKVEGIGDVTEAEAKQFQQEVDDYRNAFKLDAKKAIPWSNDTVTTLKGDKVKVAFMNTPDGGKMAMMKFNAETNTWEELTNRDLADMGNLELAAPLKTQYMNKPGYTEMITENANEAMVTEGMAAYDVFGKFTPDTWKSMLSNWDAVKAQLDQGKVPDGYNYNWTQGDTVVKTAQANGMQLISSPLLNPDDMPDSIYNGKFSAPELKKIWEFVTKTRVLHYKGQIHSWIAEAECVMGARFMNVQDEYHQKSGLLLRELGGPDGTAIMIQTAQWAKEADPSIRLRVTEDHMFETKFGSQQPDLNNQFFAFLDKLKVLKAPNDPSKPLIDEVDIENNLWIYGPPTEKHMMEILAHVKSEGFGLATPETTVITSQDYPIWFEKPPMPPVKVDNVDKAQADLYAATLRAYLKSGSGNFGFGDLGDSFSWYQYRGGTADAMIFGKDNRPKQAYYAIHQILFAYATGTLK